MLRSSCYRAKVAFALALLLLAGCASRSSPPLPPQRSMEGALRDAMVEATDELRILAKLNTAHAAQALTPEQHAQKFLAATYIPPGFERLVDFSFVGEASEAASAIAAMAGYRFEVRQAGHQGAPIYVHLDARARTLHGFFRDLVAQVGQGADIDVYPAARLIEYRVRRPPSGSAVRSGGR